MLNSRIKAALVMLAASAGLSACTSLGYGGNGLGVGVGYGNSGYGYGSPYGYGYNGYGSPYGYGYGYGSPYGFGGYPYYGWHDGFYYPGSGYWVYDPDGNQHPITDRQRSFWGSQLKKYREATGTTAQTQTAVAQNFSGFRSRAKSGATIAGVDLNAQAQADGASVRQISDARRQARAERIQQAREQRATSSASQADSGRSARQIMMESRRAKRGGGSDN